MIYVYVYAKIISDSWRHRKITTLIMFTRMRNLFQVTEIPLEPSPHQLRVSRSLARLFILIIAIVTISYVMSLAQLLITKLHHQPHPPHWRATAMFTITIARLINILINMFILVIIDAEGWIFQPGTAIASRASSRLIGWLTSPLLFSI